MLICTLFLHGCIQWHNLFEVASAPARKHNCAVIGPAFFPLFMCSKPVSVFPAAYNVRMQTLNKSLINQVLNTGILSDTLKFDKVMIRH